MSDKTGKENANNKKSETNLESVTDKNALIKIEGQEFEIDAGLAFDDKTLRTVLQPHYSSVENAEISRQVKKGKLEVKIVKKAQHKGISGQI